MTILTTKAELQLIVDDEKTAVVCFHAPGSPDSQRTVQLLAKVKPKFPTTEFLLAEANAPVFLPVLLDFNVVEIPALAVFREGHRLTTVSGVKTEKTLARILGKYLKAKKHRGRPTFMKTINNESELRAVTSDAKTAVICFHSPRSTYSRRTIEMLTEAERDFAPAQFYLVDGDADALAPVLRELKVVGLPTALIYRDGVHAKTLVGERSKKALSAMLAQCLQ
jgi:thioredoxin-like negative regulator of GroEL